MNRRKAANTQDETLKRDELGIIRAWSYCKILAPRDKWAWFEEMPSGKLVRFALSKNSNRQEEEKLSHCLCADHGDFRMQGITIEYVFSMWNMGN